jgi:hypothetical protein
MLRLLVLGFVFAFLACATLQTGILPGKLTEKDGESYSVTLGWESNGTVHDMGDMMLTLPNAERFRGSFVRISTGVKYGPSMSLYNVWNSYSTWGGGWGMPFGSYGEWTRAYSGKVLGSLSSQEGGLIRCKFEVTDAQVGFISGGTGECQTSTGGKIQLKY